MDTATIENLNHKTSPQEPCQTRRLKVVLPQCYAALAIFAVNLSHVIFHNISFNVAVSNDIGWTSLEVHGFMKWIGLLIGGIVAQITGARVIVILTGVTLVISWIILGWIFSEEYLQWILFIVPLTGGMMQAPAYVYLAEISQPNMRSALMAVLCVSTNIGTAYLNIFGTGSTKVTASINVVFACFGLVVMFFLPDSPYRLANKGRYHAVESSLAWFRGKTTVDNVKSESKAIISNAQNSPSACKLFCQNSLYVAALIVGYVFLTTTFVKIFFATFFPSIVFIHRGLGYRELTLFFGITAVLMSIGFVVLVAIIGKRLMFLISVFGGIIAIVVACIVSYLSAHILSTDADSWLHLICYAVTYFSFITGVESVPLLLNGELFPAKLRYFGTGVGLFLMETNWHNYFYIPNLLTAPVALLILAIASIIGFISLIWLFPRSDNKSLVEIEHSSTKFCTPLKKLLN